MVKSAWVCTTIAASPGGVPAAMPKNWKQELAGVEGEADEHERPPRDARARQEHGGQGGHQEAQRGERGGREIVEGQARATKATPR